MAESNSTTIVYRELDFLGFPGYRVGSDGSVGSRWSLYRKQGRRLSDQWRPMKLRQHWKGYLTVNLIPPEGGSYKTFRVHRLILEAFVGPCPEGQECRHLNGIKTDCRLENLCWGTPEQNRQDNRDLGAYQAGERHSQAKFSDKEVETMRRRRREGALLRELADEFHCSLSYASFVVRGKTRGCPTPGKPSV